MLKNKLNEYHATIIEVRNLEKNIQSFFTTLAYRDDPKFDRCADYGERLVEIVVPFDEINLSSLTLEKVEQIKNIILKYRKLRNEQKKLEVEVSKYFSIQNNIKDNMETL
jgi:hypothetical protein